MIAEPFIATPTALSERALGIDGLHGGAEALTEWVRAIAAQHEARPYQTRIVQQVIAHLVGPACAGVSLSWDSATSAHSEGRGLADPSGGSVSAASRSLADMLLTGDVGFPVSRRHRGGRLFAPPTVPHSPPPPARSRSVLVQSPTGSGKTFVGLLCADLLHRLLGLRVGWCAMRRELLQQAQAERLRFGFAVPVRPISMFDRQPPPCDLLIVDEAQHDGALSMASLHGMIRPRYVLGLSATPFRADRVKLCFERVVQDVSIQSLILEGYLSPYHHYTIEGWDPERVARIWIEDPARWGKSLAFFRTAVEADRFALALRRAGVSVEVVTGASDRTRQLAGFDSGKVRVLVSMNVLTEGFDCPSLQTVFCRPSSRAPTMQMCGRVFRRFAALPFKQVVQCRETRVPLPRVVGPAEQYLRVEQGWRALGATRSLRALSLRMRQVVAQSTPAPMPSLIMRTKQRANRRAPGFEAINEAALRDSFDRLPDPAALRAADRPVLSAVACVGAPPDGGRVGHATHSAIGRGWETIAHPTAPAR